MTTFLIMQAELVRRLNGRCQLTSAGVLSYLGEKHANCSTCDAPKCGGADLGLADAGFSIRREFGTEAIELAWPCPGCGCETTEYTDPLASTAQAAIVSNDALCYRCRAALAAKDAS